jgi:hypothetical protein
VWITSRFLPAETERFTVLQPTTHMNDVIFDAGVLIGDQHQQKLTITAMFSVDYNQVLWVPEILARSAVAGKISCKPR